MGKLEELIETVEQHRRQFDATRQSLSWTGSPTRALEQYERAAGELALMAVQEMHPDYWASRVGTKEDDFIALDDLLMGGALDGGYRVEVRVMSLTNKAMAIYGGLPRWKLKISLQRVHQEGDRTIQRSEGYHILPIGLDFGLKLSIAMREQMWCHPEAKDR